MEGMTIKEIANISNVSESTVKRWITSAEIVKPSAEMAKVTNTPFRFDLPDTIVIIKAGGKETLADLLQENAKKSTNIALPQSTEVSQIVRSTVQEMIPAMALAMAQAFKALPQRQTALPAPIELDYFSIKAYAAKCGVKVVFSDARRLGKESVHLSRSKNIQVRKVDDEQFGIVNSYHVSVLKEVFTI